MHLPYEIDEVYGCWIWLGKTNSRGYSVVWLGQTPHSAHKIVWEQHRGPVPKGKVLDHLCRRKLCVAPHHLEPIDDATNQDRKAWAHRARRKVCGAGHDLTLYAIITPEGGKVCRRCSGRDLGSA